LLPSVSAQVKAGELKCAIDEPGLQPGVERVMRAVVSVGPNATMPVTVFLFWMSASKQFAKP
jgi:predicted metal-dependent phosphotriesterase family hydrolase